MRTFRLDISHWHILRINFLLAGFFVFGSLFLAYFFSEKWLLLAGFVGLMQIFFALTGFCPSAILLDKIGFSRK